MRKIGLFGLDVVHGCQLRCIGCPNSTLKPKVMHMPAVRVRTILANVDTVRRVQEFRLYNYGEPFLNPELPEIVEVIRPYVVGWRARSVSISTNAQLVDEERIQRVIASGVITILIVSCDGDGTPEDYERLRPPAKWERLMRFLRIASEARAKYNPRMRLSIRTVIERHSAMKRWNALVEPLGYGTIFRTWKALPQSLLTIRNKWDAAPKGACDWAGHADLFVDWDGTIVPCCAHPKAADLGNIAERKLSELLENRQQFFAHMERDRASLPVCGSCNLDANTELDESMLEAECA
jgi:radical SAM protein with 4Fe4S-binding SPASM domain